MGFHTSGRNSGVVHSGFNPEPGTLKAKLCVEGSRLVRQYCKDRGIHYEQVGTYVVAESIPENVLASGNPGLVLKLYKKPGE